MYIRIKTEALLAIEELKTWITKYITEDRPRELDATGNLIIPFDDLYKEVFQLLYSKEIEMNDITAYITTDSVILEEYVPECFPDWSISSDEDGTPIKRKWKDYLLVHYVKGDKVLFLIGHNETEHNRWALTQNEELRLFINKFSTDLSNVYTKEEDMRAIVAEYSEALDEM